MSAKAETKKLWDEMPVTVKIILVLVGLVLVWMLVHFIQKKIQTSQQQDVLNNSVQVGISQTSGQPLQVDLGTSASNIYAAFYKNDFLGFTEDRPRAMTELMNVPKSLIPDLSGIYYQLYNKNIKTDFQTYLNSADWAKISSQFS